GSVPAPSRRSWPRTPARPGSASVLLYASRRSSGYNVTMTFPATSRQTRTFDDRADALAHFFLRAGEAPRLLAYDDATGCPLDQALAALEWTAAVGILSEDDLIHAARLGADAAAALVERKDGDQRVYIYFGPRMDAPPADPYEGTLLYDEPGVRAYIFAQRVHAIAHFLRATHGIGAVIAMLGRRAPELRHVRRWLQAVFTEPAGETTSTQMLAGWFATGSEPAGEHLGGGSLAGGLGEHGLQPAADMAQLGRAAGEHRDHSAQSMGRTQEVRDRVY